MINPKNIAIAAFVGFVFSFLVGLFSGIGFGHILLRALISAVICAVLGAGITFLFRQFLSDATDSGFEAPAGGEGEHGSGGLVNITIDDDVLADDGSEPKFVVEDAAVITGHAPKTEKKAEPVAEPSPVVTKAAGPVSPEESVPDEPGQADASSFKPVALGTPVQAPVAAEETHSAAVSAPSSGGHEKSELEDLPDIGGAIAVSQKDGEAVIRDSDFATGKEEPPVSLSSSKGGSAPESQNAAVMAQAIQTLLAKEN